MDAVLPEPNTTQTTAKPASDALAIAEPAHSSGSRLFSGEFAKEMARKSADKRAQIAAENKKARAIVEAMTIAAVVEPSELYRLTRLARVRAQLAQVDSAIEEAIKSPKPEKGALKSLVEAQDRLSEQERKLDNRALPGSRRPGRESTSKAPSSFEPSE